MFYAAVNCRKLHSDRCSIQPGQMTLTVKDQITHRKAYLSATSSPTYDMIYNMIYFSTANGLTPSGSSTAHIYIQTKHRITQ